MRTKDVRALLLAGAAVLPLAGCGGGGGMLGINSVSAPVAVPTPALTPTPPPPPAPPALADVQIFTPPPTDKLTTIGLEAPGDSNANLTDTGFSVSYDESLQRYLVKVPSMTSGYFYRRSVGDVDPSWWIGTLADSERNGAHGNVTVLKPSNPQLQLSYTTLGYYNEYDPSVPFGYFAFGSATPSGSVPVIGTATYSALIRGSTTSRFYVDGSAELQFDFAQGKLAGFMEPIVHDRTGLGFEDTPLGQYAFVNTVYGTGAISFSGQLSNANVSGLGSFDGVFTGPSGQEVMARWSAPWRFPFANDPSQMFGVLVGKKQ